MTIQATQTGTYARDITRNISRNSDSMEDQKALNLDMSPEDLVVRKTEVDSFNEKLKAQPNAVVSKNKLEEADFMSLLITQLKSQDPTKPLDDKEFIGQMASFTSLKQMNELTANFKNLTKEFSFTKAVSMVNRAVTYTDPSGNVNEGVVQSIKVKNGESFLNIDGAEVAMESVSEVKNSKTEPVPAVFAK
jgi:flagellar basal-body rod modification protein FlgD